VAKSAQLLRLERRMAAIPAAVREAVAPAVVKAGERLAATMRQLAPEDTGALKESIAVTLPGHMTPPYSQPGGMRVAGELEVLVTVGGEEVRYPHLVEYGTSDTDAQPFFWPAVRMDQKTNRNAIRRAAAKAVRDVVKKP
jgi:HK97 gp10 family phage protein